MNEHQPARPTLQPLAPPLASKLEKWEQLRDELVALAAQLETMNLMLRLQQRRS